VWVKLLQEHHDFLLRIAQDPSQAKPKKLETALRRQWPEIELGSNTTKNWLAGFRQQKQGIYTSTQAALHWLEEKDAWYRYCVDEDNAITGIFWCTPQQVQWIREQRFSGNISLDCTYATNNKKMPYFQGTIVTHTKKILPLFQGIVDNERESGFRWLLEQVHDLLRECRNKEPDLFITDYDTALINALAYEFPQSKHQLCIFHINMNVVLNIKKKWQRRALEASSTDSDTENTTDEDLESDDEEFGTQGRTAKKRHRAGSKSTSTRKHPLHENSPLRPPQDYGVCYRS
jgi:hypothetical protein